MQRKGKLRLYVWDYLGIVYLAGFRRVQLMSYSLNSLKGVVWITIGAIKGDTRSLDYGSY